MESRIHVNYYLLVRYTTRVSNSHEFWITQFSARINFYSVQQMP